MVCMATKLYASCEYFLSGDQFIILGHQKMTFKKGELGTLIWHCVGPHLCALIASSTIIIAIVLDT